MQPKISLQTFTIRRYLKSPQAIEQAFSTIKEMGLNAVELAYIRFKPAEIEAVARAAKRHNIDIGSSQITFDYLKKNKNWVLDFHLQQLDCEIASVSVLPRNAIVGDQNAMLRFAEELNQLGEFYGQRGLQLCFHHHDFEFRRYGKTMGLELIMQNTSSDNVGLVVDTYWTQRGGKTPQDLIQRFADRVKVIHLRDYTVRRKLFEMTPTDTALGQGNLDIKGIVASCCQSGVRYMAIEQATKDPYKNVATSVKHLKSLGLGHFL